MLQPIDSAGSPHVDGALDAGANVLQAGRDLASMVQRGVRAQQALLAWLEGTEWSAVTPQGRMVRGGELSAVASVRSLHQAQAVGRPVAVSIVKDGPFGIEGALVVPFSVGAGDGARVGCLYAHRTRCRPPFSADDLEVMSAVVRVARPFLGVVPMTLQSRSGKATDSLGGLRSRDHRFRRSVMAPLHRACRVERVGLLLLGPSGSGKSHLAQAYHRACPRAGRALVTVNCGSFRSSDTLGAELLGFAARSGFHNAPAEGRAGKASLADGGSLFLDEIGCLSPELQPQLLRLIETGRFSPLGSSQELEVDIQIIAATNLDLVGEVEAGRFREDLYWRLCDVVVELPALSERMADFDLLVDDLLAAARDRTRRFDVEALAPGARRLLRSVDWSRAGNVRGLQKTIERSVILAEPGTVVLEAEQIQLLGRASRSEPGPGATTARDRERSELESVKEAIRHHGKATLAAEALGISYRELYWKLQKAGLSVSRVLHGA